MASYKNIMSRMWQGAEDIAGDIAGSRWVKAMATDDFVREGQQTIAKKMSDPMSKVNTNKIRGALESHLASWIENNPGEDALRVQDLISKVNNKNYEATMEQIRKITGNKYKRASSWNNPSTFEPEDIKDILQESSIPLNYQANLGMAYFQHPEKGLTRTGTAVGAAGAAVLGGRFLSGGTLTKDSYGNNDIVGIPFV